MLGDEASQVKKTLEACLDSTTLLLTGGQDFIVRVARTETMKKKESVKNVMHCIYKVLSLVILSQKKVKHNSVQEISLSTTKSISLPVYVKESTKEEA
jgi:hypothetical protein